MTERKYRMDGYGEPSVIFEVLFFGQRHRNSKEVG